MTGDGYRAILSAPWYLNYIDYGSDWTQYYKVDPTDFGGKDDNLKLVVGGEVRYVYLYILYVIFIATSDSRNVYYTSSTYIRYVCGENLSTLSI